jgi:hypothetical protein
MTSASPLVQACIVQAQADALASSDIAVGLYLPQLEAIIESTLKAVAASALISGTGQTTVTNQLALAAADSE